MTYHDLAQKFISETDTLTQAFNQLENHHIERSLNSQPKDGWQLVHDFSTGVETIVKSACNELIPLIGDTGALCSTGASARMDASFGSDFDFLHIHFGDSASRKLNEKISQKGHEIGSILGQRYDGIVIRFDADNLSEVGGDVLNEVAHLRHITGHHLQDRIATSLRDNYTPELRLADLLRGWNKMQKTEMQPYSLDSFNIKKSQGGLRNFMFSYWIEHVSEPNEFSLDNTPNDIVSALSHLHFARNWGHITKRGNFISRDIWESNDFSEYAKQFGSEAFKDLIESRQRITSYSKAKVDKLIGDGIPLSDNVLYTVPGLLATTPEGIWPMHEMAQKHGFPISPSNNGERSKFIPPRHALEFLGEEGDIVQTILSAYEGGFCDKLLPHSTEGTMEILPYFGKTQLEVNVNRLKSLQIFLEDKELDISSNGLIALRVAAWYNENPQVIGELEEQYDVSNRAMETARYLIDKQPKIFRFALEGSSNEDWLERIQNNLRKPSDLDLLLALAHSFPETTTPQPHLLDTIKEAYNKIQGEPLEVNMNDVDAFVGDGLGMYAKGLTIEFRTSTYQNDYKKALLKIQAADENKKPLVDRLKSRGDQVTFRIATPDTIGLLPIIAGVGYKHSKGTKNLHTYTLFDEEKPLGIALDYLTVRSPPGNFADKLETEITNLLEKKLSPGEVYSPFDDDPFEILSQFLTVELTREREKYGTQYMLKIQTDKPVRGAVWAASSAIQPYDVNIFSLRSSKVDAGGYRHILNFSTEYNEDKLRNGISNWTKR